MNDFVFGLFAIAWIACGTLAGQLLSYSGDGINFRHFVCACLGPPALLIAAIDRARP